VSVRREVLREGCGSGEGEGDGEGRWCGERKGWLGWWWRGEVVLREEVLVVAVRDEGGWREGGRVGGKGRGGGKGRWCYGEVTGKGRGR